MHAVQGSQDDRKQLYPI